MNEHQLMFGECTDGAKITANPEPGASEFSIRRSYPELLWSDVKPRGKRWSFAGSLIEKYGYYGTGETLPVADPNEAWVMEMAPSPTGTGGLRVAQKVPDGEVFVAANEFRIRDIDPNDPNIFAKIFLVSPKNTAGGHRPKGTLDWLPTVSLGEYNHPYYSLRRVWRVLSLVAPHNLSPWVKDGLTRDYPQSSPTKTRCPGCDAAIATITKGPGV